MAMTVFLPLQVPPGQLSEGEGGGGGGVSGGEGEVTSTARYAEQRERETCAKGRAYRNTPA